MPSRIIVLQGERQEEVDRFAEIMQSHATKDVMIFGMDVKTVLALLYQYMRRKGPLPPTPESIREVFKDG